MLIRSITQIDELKDYMFQFQIVSKLHLLNTDSTCENERCLMVTVKYVANQLGRYLQNIPTMFIHLNLVSFYPCKLQPHLITLRS